MFTPRIAPLTRVLLLAGVLAARAAAGVSDDAGEPDGYKLVAAGQDQEAEAFARKRLTAAPADADGHTVLGMVHELRAFRNVGKPGGPSGPVQAEVRLAIRELITVLEGPRFSPRAWQSVLKLLPISNESGQLLQLVKALPDDAMKGEPGRQLEEAVLMLPARKDQDLALMVLDVWLKRLPDELPARRAAAYVWPRCGFNDKAFKEISGWHQAKFGGHDWSVALAESAILSARWDEAKAVLHGAGPARLTELRALFDAGAPTSESVAGLRALGASEPGAPVKQVAELLGAWPAQDEKAREESLLRVANKLCDQFHFVEPALAIRARKLSGAWTEADTILSADLYRKMRDWARELEHVQQVTAAVDKRGATETGVSKGDWHFRIGRILFHMDRYPEAEREYALSASYGKDDSELHFHIAKNYGMMGRKKEAMDELKRAAAGPKAVTHADKARAQLQAIEASPSASPWPVPSPAK